MDEAKNTPLPITAGQSGGNKPAAQSPDADALLIQDLEPTEAGKSASASMSALYEPAEGDLRPDATSSAIADRDDGQRSAMVEIISPAKEGKKGSKVGSRGESKSKDTSPQEPPPVFGGVRDTVNMYEEEAAAAAEEEAAIAAATAAAQKSDFVYVRGKGMMDKWEALDALAVRLPTGRTDSDRRLRKNLFNSFDPNGNGYLSLAEVQKGVRDVLQSDALFDAKPAIMRAFQAAKNAVDTKSRLGADFVERAEFRALLVYLQRYFEMYVMFNRIDTSRDHRINEVEFMAAVFLLADWGLIMEDSPLENEFAAIDTNGGGFILFDEFCDWALAGHRWPHMDVFGVKAKLAEKETPRKEITATAAAEAEAAEAAEAAAAAAAMARRQVVRRDP